MIFQLLCLFLALVVFKTVLGVGLVYYAGYAHNLELNAKKAKQSASVLVPSLEVAAHSVIKKLHFK